MSDYAIDTDQLCLVYKRKLALDHLTLRLPRGGIHAFIGANGAGKSSLFRVLLGFEPAASGSARVLGHDCTRLTPELRGRIGFVNEEHTLPAWMGVSELVHMQRRQSARWNGERFDAVLRHFNVLPEQRVGQLSRGERAGLNLALALRRHEQAEPGARVQPALGIQLGIGFRHRVRIDRQLLGQAAHAGQGGAVRQFAAGDQALDAIGDLAPDGPWIAGHDLQHQGGRSTHRMLSVLVRLVQ